MRCVLSCCQTKKEDTGANEEGRLIWESFVSDEDTINIKCKYIRFK